jgi:hypothetical protein
MPAKARKRQQIKSKGREFMRDLRLCLALALSCAAWGPAYAEISGDVVRVGVLNDISGIFQDTNGMGSVEAARMAAEDFNGVGKNIKVEIVYARTRPMWDPRSRANGLRSTASMPLSTCQTPPSASPSTRLCAIPR